MPEGLKTIDDLGLGVGGVRLFWLSNRKTAEVKSKLDAVAKLTVNLATASPVSFASCQFDCRATRGSHRL